MSPRRTTVKTMLDQKIKDSRLPIGFIAEATGIPVTTLYEYRTGKTVPPDEARQKIAAFLTARGVPTTADELKTGEYRGRGRPRKTPAIHEHRHPAPILRLVTVDGRFVDFESEPEEEMVGMVVEARVAAGTPRELDEIPREDRETVEVPAAFLKGATGRWLLKVVGGSMVSAKIHDGSYVIVRKADEARNRQVVVVLFDDGTVTIKRYRDDGGRKRLQADSPEHRDIPLTSRTGNVKILGVVERVIGEPEDTHHEPRPPKRRPRSKS